MSYQEKPKKFAWMADWPGTVAIFGLVGLLWVGWQTALVVLSTVAFVLVLIWLFGK